MKLVPIFAISLLLLHACASSKDSHAKLPSLKITAATGVVLRPDCTWISVEGIGATPGKTVTIQLLRVTETTTYPEVPLGKATADEYGFFAFSVVQTCVFPHGRVSSMTFYQAIDDETKRKSGSSKDLGSRFLECP